MKNKTITEINKALPNLKSEKVSDYANELDRVLALKRIFESEDGKELINELRETIVSTISKLTKVYKTADLSTMMGLCAVLDGNFNMLMKMKDISLEDEIRKDLDLAVLEASRE